MKIQWAPGQPRRLPEAWAPTLQECVKGGPLSCRLDPAKQQAAGEELVTLKRKAQSVLLSQDEARFPLVPTLRAPLGVKGHRLMVGTWDNKDQASCFAALNVVTGKLTT